MMKVSEHGINMVKSFEGLRLKAYRDAAGVWTIGYGSTRYPDDIAVKQGEVLPNEQAASLLLTHTLSTYEMAVVDGVKVPLNQNQFDALVSLTYNVGEGIMQSSTLITKLNARDFGGAADQFLRWNKITNPVTHMKEVSANLSDRRKQERALFLKPYENDTKKG